MVGPNSFFQSVVPSDPRLQVDLPCIITLSDESFEAKLYNISYGGFAVRVPEAKNTFELAKLQSVAISDIGDFAVQVRWRRMGCLGLKFQSKRSARALLDAYFARTDEFPI